MEERQVTSLGGPDNKKVDGRGIINAGGGEKQGRQRSMPLTTLPAPEIEIGSRLPVNYSMPRFCKEKCDPVHKWSGKLQQDAEKACPRATPMDRNRFSLATNAERVCAEIMLKNK
jgi:hypothetical protein